MDSHTLGEGESHKHLVLGLIWQIIAVSYLTLKMRSHSWCIFSNATRQKILNSDRKIQIFLSANKTLAMTWLFQNDFVSECLCFFNIDFNWLLLQRFLFNKISLQEVPGLIALLQDGETIEDLLKLSPEQLLTRWVNYQLDKVTKRTFRWFYIL